MPNRDEQQENEDGDTKPKFGVMFMLRGPVGLKHWAVQASRKRNMKLTPWLIEAITEKCQRELPRDE